jgi:hypothetical protein
MEFSYFSEPRIRYFGTFDNVRRSDHLGCYFRYCLLARVVATCVDIYVGFHFMETLRPFSLLVYHISVGCDFSNYSELRWSWIVSVTVASVWRLHSDVWKMILKWMKLI